MPLKSHLPTIAKILKLKAEFLVDFNDHTALECLGVSPQELGHIVGSVVQEGQRKEYSVIRDRVRAEVKQKKRKANEKSTKRKASEKSSCSCEHGYIWKWSGGFR